MMSLSDQDIKFLSFRRRVVKLWPLLGSVISFVLLCLFLWLFFHNNSSLNPWGVLARLKADAIDKKTLILTAALFPIVFLMAFFILFFLIAFSVTVITNEKKYLKIIDSLSAERNESEPKQRRIERPNTGSTADQY